MREDIGSVRSIFVYGTLKRGQRNACVWPVEPVEVVEAIADGTLYDCGYYPAMQDGDDRIEGELWTFAAEDMPLVIARLDMLEGCRGTEHDLYNRVVRTVAAAGLEPTLAVCYHYNRPVDGLRRIEAVDGYAQWSGQQPVAVD